MEEGEKEDKQEGEKEGRVNYGISASPLSQFMQFSGFLAPHRKRA